MLVKAATGNYGFDFKCVIFRCIEVIIFMNIAGVIGFS